MIEFLILLFTSTDKKVEWHKHQLKTEPLGFCGCWMVDICIVPGCEYRRERRCNQDELKKYLGQ